MLEGNPRPPANGRRCKGESLDAMETTLASRPGRMMCACAGCIKLKPARFQVVWARLKKTPTARNPRTRHGRRD